MELDNQLLSRIFLALQKGLPLCSEPFESIATECDCSSELVIKAIEYFKIQKYFKRFGVVVNHRKLGYTENAMVVWDLDEGILEDLANQISSEKKITLCYQRPKVLPHWPYNLFTMIHAKDRESVSQFIDSLKLKYQINAQHDILFSTQSFKQTGAQYSPEHIQRMMFSCYQTDNNEELL